MSDALDALPELLAAHLQLSIMAVLIGTAFAVPAGILAAARPRVGRAVVGLASIIQTIPALALLALMVPLLASMNLRSIGTLPAAIALVLYGLLPVIRNTIVALTTIDPALREAAQGVGMTPMQQLWLVELPLARPVILAGIRTATVTTVGMATLSTPVGAPSLGNLIFGGLQTRNLAFVLVGCISAAALAIALDQCVAAVARLSDSAEPARRATTGPWYGLRMNRAAALLLTGALVALVLVGAVAFRSGAVDGGGRAVVIGAKPFTEQFILAEVIAEVLRRRTSSRVDLRTSLGSTVAYDGVQSGAIDVYVDYTGTLWTTTLKETESPPSRERAIATLTRELAARHDVRLLGGLGFENAYCLAMRRADAEALGVSAIGDLAGHAQRLSVAGDYEFFGRQEWRAITERYRLRMAQELTMDPALLFAAIESRQVDLVSAYTTDPRLESLDLTVLTDPLGAIPPYDAVLLASAAFVKDRPAEVTALEALFGAIDASAMRRMNLAVDRDGRSPREVAVEFVNTLK